MFLWLNKPSNQTDLKGQHNFRLFYCQLSSFKQCSADLIFPWEQLVSFSLYYYLIIIVNIKILSLNFFYKAT